MGSIKVTNVSASTKTNAMFKRIPIWTKVAIVSIGRMRLRRKLIQFGKWIAFWEDDEDFVPREWREYPECDCDYCLGKKD